ncbi:heterodisulfide reductase-related iron-sulfur binding cluster [Tunturiibacter lichenicola]|uniref:heterodisulfide reductase-related iron-sulfur binding cluster n=1 Tax=Tunturiibacter lichenicola TaxID=2051959 RepID=UPI003D9BE55B
MLPFPQKIAFLIFAIVTLALGLQGFYRLYLRIRRGTADPEPRFNNLLRRLVYALTTTLTQQRTFKKRPAIGLFHSFIFYGFVFYGLVNLVDAAEGYILVPSGISFSSNLFGLAVAIVLVIAAYKLFADILSFLVLLGVIALVIRRFALSSRRDFRFNPRTLLHPDVLRSKIPTDSLIVSAFILFHVGSRAIGAAAKIAIEDPDKFQPFATLLSHLVNPAHAEALRIFGYWGALGSVLAFLAYFPYTKHIHIFMAPAKYLVAREPTTGVLPLAAIDIDTEADTKTIGANKLEDLAWPRLLDAYACIQCNRCQDVCPATATGKSLSPAALEINKRMELNDLASQQTPFTFTAAPFEKNTPSPNPLLQFALSPEAAWACTTCGACMEVCPTQNEQMLDIIDIRRNQVMIEGEFPSQLQSAFRGMERAQNPWGINHEQRLAWADGLNVKTTDENPTPDVLYWVGCAASYDPQAQKTARAFVELLNHADVNFAVLGKKECCTGDSARRAGNEYLYRQLADKNVSTLNTVKPKLVVASCPHCMNSIGHEYKQIGGDYKVMHHTEYLETLVANKKLTPTRSEATITYHDPCYLGRHNGVYEAPRNLLHILGNATPELPRNRENAFCCGAGGAQFWKEEEEGNERISDNRFREAQQTLAPAAGEKVLAVGCPFCKSMLGSTPGKANSEDIAIKDVAELLLEGVRRSKGLTTPTPKSESIATTVVPDISESPAPASPVVASQAAETIPTETTLPEPPSVERKKWQPKSAIPTQHAEQSSATVAITPTPASPSPAVPERKKWQPKTTALTHEQQPAQQQASEIIAAPSPTVAEAQSAPALQPPTSASPTERKKWQPKSPSSNSPTPSVTPPESAPLPAAEPEAPTPPADAAPARKKWTPKKPT